MSACPISSCSHWHGEDMIDLCSGDCSRYCFIAIRLFQWSLPPSVGKVMDDHSEKWICLTEITDYDQLLVQEVSPVNFNDI